MQTSADPTPTPTLPAPRQGARWRWSTSRRALIGGGVLAAALGLGSVAAGAASTTATKPPAGAPAGAPPAGMTKPTAAGKITALSGDDITLTQKDNTTETVVYSAATIFRDQSGTTASSALKTGQFIAVMGTKNTDGTVTATSIMIGMPARNGHGPGGKPPVGKGGTPPAGKGGMPPAGGPPSA